MACYVSNYDSLVYTGPGQGSDVTKAQGAVDGINGLRQPEATVAMEFSRIEDELPAGGLPSAPITFSDPAQVVKFYVFNYATNPAGSPVNAANLDGLGARPVPQLCMVCHGGHIPNPSGVTTTQLGIPTPVFGSRDDVKLGAKFLPFDLQNLTFVATGPFNQANQEDAFRQLNKMVKVAPPPDAADPTSTVISALYDAWYPGDVAPQRLSVAVAQWDDPGDPQRALHKQVYTDTVARGCRTCHVANADPVLRFDRPSSFDARLGAVQQRVCLQHVMPHARRTHDLFWTSTNPSQPAGLQAYGDTVSADAWQKVGTTGVDPSLLCGQEYTQGGGPTAPPTQFSPVASIISGKCAFCHTTANAANVADLDLQANAYNHLVGVNAKELSTFKRVLGGINTEVPSYFRHKVSGDFAGLPGTFTPPGPGGQMPLFDSPLPSQQLDTIRNWIRNGAQP